MTEKDMDGLSRSRKEGQKEGWKIAWGQEYAAWNKFKTLGPLFGELEKDRKIGELVIDVGSGFSPISQHIPGKHKIITIDYAGNETILGKPILHNETMHLRYDAEHISDSKAFDSRRALINVARFLGADPRNRDDRKYADTMLFSEILNYVDFRSVLSGFSHYLKPDGRFLIVNMPEKRGYHELYSERGLKNNTELKEFLESSGFEIEKAIFPWSDSAQDQWDDQGMIFLVARKKNGAVIG